MFVLNPLDADFGMAYSIGGLTAEGSINDLKQQFTGKGLSFSNFNTFYSAFSYLFELNDWNLTPKIAYHGIKDFKNKLKYETDNRIKKYQSNDKRDANTNARQPGIRAPMAERPPRPEKHILFVES